LSLTRFNVIFVLLRIAPGLVNCAAHNYLLLTFLNLWQSRL